MIRLNSHTRPGEIAVSPRPAWTFITNHGAVLALLARYGQITARQIAVDLDITTRTVRRIIADLESEGYIQIRKEGRRNHYQIDHDRPLRREDQRTVMVGELLAILQENDPG
jgi:predicted ArsR family transcriptional regulator